MKTLVVRRYKNFENKELNEVFVWDEEVNMIDRTIFAKSGLVKEGLSLKSMSLTNDQLINLYSWFEEKGLPFKPLTQIEFTRTTGFNVRELV